MDANRQRLQCETYVGPSGSARIAPTHRRVPSTASRTSGRPRVHARCLFSWESGLGGRPPPPVKEMITWPNSSRPSGESCGSSAGTHDADHPLFRVEPTAHARDIFVRAWNRSGLRRLKIGRLRTVPRAALLEPRRRWLHLAQTRWEGCTPAASSGEPASRPRGNA